jgi:hypothetical protein
VGNRRKKSFPPSSKITSRGLLFRTETGIRSNACAVVSPRWPEFSTRVPDSLDSIVGYSSPGSAPTPSVRLSPKQMIVCPADPRLRIVSNPRRHTLTQSGEGQAEVRDYDSIRNPYVSGPQSSWSAIKRLAEAGAVQFSRARWA